MPRTLTDMAPSQLLRIALGLAALVALACEEEHSPRPDDGSDLGPQSGRIADTGTGGVGDMTRGGSGGMGGTSRGGSGSPEAPAACGIVDGEPCGELGALESCCRAMCPPYADGVAGGQPYTQGFVCLRYGDELRWYSCGTSQAPGCFYVPTDDTCTLPKPDEETQCWCGQPCPATQRYWPNPRSGRCETYAVCPDGPISYYASHAPNSFSTREECEVVCGSVLDADAGADHDAGT